MKKLLTNIFAVTAISLSLGLTIGLTNKVHNVEAKEVVAETVEQYYSSISDSLNGDNLRTALNTLNKSKRKSTVGYAGMRQFAAVCDADPDGSGKIIGFYDNKKVGPAWDSGNTWNREHVWPNVRGGSSVEDDAHMTRPASTQTNSDRGSKGYGMTSYDPGQFVAYYRGAASRIIFYAAIADLNLNLVDDPLNYNGGTPANSMGSLSEMLAWNLQYLPSDTSFTGDNDLARRTELNRNEKIQTASGGQGNRNPFIDHPEYACKIWGNYNEATKKACEGHYTPITSTVSFDQESVTLEVDEKVTLKATSSNGGTINWIISNSHIALDKTSTTSGGEVTITGKTEGTTKITATNEEGASKECMVTVNKKTVKPDDPTITLSKTEISLNIGETSSISATSDVTPLSWFTNNDNVEIDKDSTESGEQVTITAKKAGQTILSVTNDYGIIEKCTITVVDPNPTEPEKEKESSNKKLFGCGGSIIASSSVVFIASILGLTFFIRRRKEQ